MRSERRRDTLDGRDTRAGAGAFAAALTLLLALALVGSPTALARTAGEAFGAPGARSWWAPATNDFVGTAQGTGSRVWFTGYSGVVGAVLWPTPDTPNTTDLQFMVGDAAHTWTDEEKSDTAHTVALADPRALIWRVTNTDRDGRYRLEKEIFTDPGRDALVQRVTFTALVGTVGDLELYTLYNPTVSNSGDNDSGRAVGRYLEASDGNGRTSALGSSLAFVPGMRSSGFVGRSDLWTDLHEDHRMDWTYDSATRGNVAQGALLDWGSAATQTSVTFTLVLAFGDSAAAARAAADGTLAGPVGALRATYVQGWNAWANALDPLGPGGDQEYLTAAMTIRAHKDKAGGALVAGLGNPWGDGSGDGANGGYHLVWARDLYEKASALLAAGDSATGGAAVDWLFARQQEPDGSFPQNSWVDGSPYWTGEQLDETAFAILLAYKVGRTSAAFYRNEIKPAAEFLAHHGPGTGQERWEENGGRSPATLAAAVAGLVAAGRIAELNHDPGARDFYLARADYWQAMTPSWTFTTSGPLGDGSYFERIDGGGDPDDGGTLQIANGGGTWPEREIVDQSYLELVRHGVRPADDAYVTASLPESDAVLRRSIPGRGDFWLRYNHDGYGENPDGSDYDGSGIGRLWPLLSGERGHYELAADHDPSTYLAAMRNAANAGGMIPEQVWDPAAPAPFVPGTPTKSMTPLGWSMAEYVMLSVSRQRGHITGQADVVHDRYVTHAFRPDPARAVDSRVVADGGAGARRAVTIAYGGARAGAQRITMHWGTDGWAPGTVADRRMVRRPDGRWEATVSVPGSARSVDVAFTDGSGWDNNHGADWHIAVGA